MDASSTYLVSNKNSLTVTISGYAASQTGIDLSFVAGIPFEGAGTWANIATLNSNNIVTGTTAGAAYYVGYNDNGTQTLSSATFPFSGTVTPFSAVIYDFSGVTADASGAISFTVNGAAAHSAGLSAIKLSVIPEPSAFGLLAGLGALALAGARRRRSRK